MTFVPVPDGCKVEVIGTLGGQIVENVLWFIHPGGFSDSDMDDLLLCVRNTCQSSLGILQSEHYSVSRLVATDMRTEGAHQRILVSGANSGSVTGNGLAGGSAAVVTKRTEKRGRSYRGRYFIPGLAASIQDVVNTLDSTWVSFVLVALADLLVPASMADFVWSVVSFYHDHVKLSTATSEPITAISMDDSVDSQRRRLAGRGS